MSETSSKPQIHRWVFWPAATIVVLFASFAILTPNTAEALFESVQSAIVGSFNWYYVLLATALVVFSLWAGFSKFGDIKLGKDEDEPEFSLGSWFALLFAAGMGIGLVFYGVSEPLSHYASPKPGVTGSPGQLAQEALTQTFLHWGVHAWSIYVVVGLALAYAIHRRGRPVSIRWALEPMLGTKRVRGPVGHIIDIIALVGTIFGVATSLGLGVLQISAGLEHAGLIESSVVMDMVIIAVVTCFVLFSVLSGVGKGMKWLSNTNLIIAGVFIVFLLIVGPTQFLLRAFVQSTGNYMLNFLGMSLNVSAFAGAEGEAWQSTWTTFYWGWWISWAPFVGIFIARISRGRTVRQFVSGVILVPTLVTLLWFSILGGTALHSELNGPGGLVAEDGTVDSSGALFSALAQVPAGAVLTIGAITMVVIFFVTSADSGALVMGMIASGGDVEPKNWIRIFFTLATSFLASALLLSGGLEALKTAAIIIALPFSVVLILICASTYQAFSREVRAYEKAKRAAFVDHIGDFYGLEVENHNGISPMTVLHHLTARLRRQVPAARKDQIDPFGHHPHKSAASPAPGKTSPAPRQLNRDGPAAPQPHQGQKPPVEPAPNTEIQQPRAPELD